MKLEQQDCVAMRRIVAHALESTNCNSLEEVMAQDKAVPSFTSVLLIRFTMLPIIAVNGIAENLCDKGFIARCSEGYVFNQEGMMKWLDYEKGEL